MEMEKTLSDDERIILRNIDSKYKYIARDEDGLLRLYKTKPRKFLDIWSSVGWTWFYVYNHLFQFIQWTDKEPTLITDLLKEK